MISAARDADNIRHAVRLGAVHYPVKPFGFTQLRDRLESTWVQSIAWATHPV
jgi:response regulator of citrate/malate metabolism